MREYRAKRSTVLFTIGFLALMTALSVVGLLLAEPRWFFVVILFALAWERYRHMRAPVRIVVKDDGSMRFRGLLSQTELDPKDITRIRRAGRYCSLEHDGRTTNLYANMEGMKEFLAGLLSANPDIDVKTFTWAQKK
jgi:hypothetical protein